MTDSLHSKLRAIKSCESTQDEVRRILESSESNPLLLQWIMADSQRKGRGRLGSQWKTSHDPEAQLIASVGIKNNSIENLGPLLSLVAGRALHAAIHSLGVKRESEIFIKWPNDIYARENSTAAPKKIAGVLSELRPKLGLVIGIGVNLKWSPSIDSLYATDSLDRHLASPPAKLRKTLMSALEKEVQTSLGKFLQQPGTFATDLLAELRLVGMRTLFDLEQISILGRLVKPLRLADDGSLEVFDLVDQTLRTLR